MTAGGKKIAPQPVEAKLKTSRWVAEAVLIGDGRPFVVCLIVPDFVHLEAEASSRGWRTSPRHDWLESAQMQALFQTEIDAANRDRAPFEQIKRFALLERELTLEAGELTPTLKVKRRTIAEHYAAEIEHLYTAHNGHGHAGAPAA